MARKCSPKKKSVSKSSKLSSHKKASGSTHLLEFHGTECPHCVEMEPIMDEVEKETGRKIRRMEVWHSAENQKKFMELDMGRCGGVPFFINTKTKKYICGATTKEKLKAWALDK